THHDGQVGERLENPSRTAASARAEALEHQRLAHVRLGDDEIVDVEVVIVLGVGDRRLQALAHFFGDALARKLEVGERGRGLLSADERGEKIELLRRDPQHAGDRLGLVLGEAALALAFAHGFVLTRSQPAVPLRRARAPAPWSCALPCGRPSARGTGAWARTRRTCGPPFPR